METIYGLQLLASVFLIAYRLFFKGFIEFLSLALIGSYIVPFSAIRTDEKYFDSNVFKL